MDFYGITMKDIFKWEKVATLPIWTSNDERRGIYVEDEEKYYFGTDASWKEITYA